MPQLYTFEPYRPHPPVTAITLVQGNRPFFRRVIFVFFFFLLLVLFSFQTTNALVFTKWQGLSHHNRKLKQFSTLAIRSLFFCCVLVFWREIKKPFGHVHLLFFFLPQFLLYFLVGKRGKKMPVFDIIKCIWRVLRYFFSLLRRTNRKLVTSDGVFLKSFHASNLSRCKKRYGFGKYGEKFQHWAFRIRVDNIKIWISNNVFVG